MVCIKVYTIMYTLISAELHYFPRTIRADMLHVLTVVLLCPDIYGVKDVLDQ